MTLDRHKPTAAFPGNVFGNTKKFNLAIDVRPDYLKLQPAAS